MAAVSICSACRCAGRCRERLRSPRRVTSPGRLVFTTSFGLEDQAIIHAIAA